MNNAGRALNSLGEMKFYIYIYIYMISYCRFNNVHHYLLETKYFMNIERYSVNNINVHQCH